MRIAHLCFGIFATSMTASFALAQAGTWTNPGTQTLTVNANFYPASTQRYVAPGSKITFDVLELVENDTVTDCVSLSGSHQEADPNKQGRLRKSGGTVSGSWSPTFSSTGKQTYTVPTTATAGQTIEIKSELHDTRTAPDPRWDDWSTIATWQFTVSTDCPDNMTVDSLTDLSGTRPNAGETYGKYRATMKANGTPPAGRSNWDGTTVTETVGVGVGNAAEWVAPNPIGSPSNSGSTFTFGSAGTDKFNDTHSTNPQPQLIQLAATINSASYTRSQVYTCSSTKDYSFTITRTANRLDIGLATERVKITVTK